MNRAPTFSAPAAATGQAEPTRGALDYSSGPLASPAAAPQGVGHAPHAVQSNHSPGPRQRLSRSGFGEPELPPTIPELAAEAAQRGAPGMAVDKYVRGRTSGLSLDERGPAMRAMLDALSDAGTLPEDRFMEAWRSGVVGPLARVAASGSLDDEFIHRSMLLPLRARWIRERGLESVTDLLLLDLALVRLLRVIRGQEFEAEVQAFLTERENAGESALGLLERAEGYVARCLKGFERLLALLDGARPTEVTVTAGTLNVATQQVVSTGQG